MLPFQDATPTPAGDWRHIVRFGRNVASYKFALGRVLLDLAAQQQTFVRLGGLRRGGRIRGHLRIEVEDAGGPWRGGPRDDDSRQHGFEVVAAIVGPRNWGMDGDARARITWARLGR